MRLTHQTDTRGTRSNELLAAERIDSFEQLANAWRSTSDAF